MAALMVGLGKTVVPNSGTPVQVQIPAAIAGPGNPGLSTVHAFVVEVLSNNTGKVYIGVQGLSKTTLVGCLVVLPIPTANLLPTFSVSMTAAANALSLSDLWIDADNAGEGVMISAILA